MNAPISRRPAGTPLGGQFAPTQHNEADIELTPPGSSAQPTPYGHGEAWNADPLTRRELEIEFAAQLAETQWGRSDARQLARRIYSGVAMYRGIPLAEFADGTAAAKDATERADDALFAFDQQHPGATALDRGRVAYDAVLDIIEDQQNHRFAPTGFTSRRPFAERSLYERMTHVEDRPDDEPPPTKHDVAAAKAVLDSMTPVRPMYRGDWERVNGGHGPTVAQHRAQQSAMNESRDERGQARAEYERLLAAWEASDKSQDDDAVRCGNCGFWFNANDGDCPQCGES